MRRRRVSWENEVSLLFVCRLIIENKICLWLREQIVGALQTHWRARNTWGGRVRLGQGLSSLSLLKKQMPHFTRFALTGRIKRHHMSGLLLSRFIFRLRNGCVRISTSNPQKRGYFCAFWANFGDSGTETALWVDFLSFSYIKPTIIPFTCNLNVNPLHQILLPELNWWPFPALTRNHLWRVAT